MTRRRRSDPDSAPPPSRNAGAALAACVLAFAGACRATGPAHVPAQRPADPAPETTLFSARRIYLGAPDWTSVEAVVVRDARVVAVGSAARLREDYPQAVLRRFDGVGVPGLQDAHGHVEGLGAALEWVDLRGTRSFEEVVERVAARAHEEPAGTWILGRGWDQNRWSDTAFPVHAPLSARTPEHPVYLVRVDGHAALANARALEIAGLGGVDVAAPAGGEILRDDRGAPTGVLVDAATERVERAIPGPDPAARTRRLLAAQSALLAAGDTAVHDMGVDEWTVQRLRELRDEGLWRLRVVLYRSASATTIEATLREGRVEPDPLDVVCVPGVKLYADGALGSRGAALLVDYLDRPGHRGLWQTEPGALASALERCLRAGLQPAVHAIGDAANRAVLDALERAAAAGADLAAVRPRIEHAQVVAPADWRRFDQLGVVPSMQPTHCSSDMPWVPARIGLERSRGAYAWKRLRGRRAPLAFGSDFPVEGIDPLEGLAAACTRQDASGEPARGILADECLDAREALEAFTLGAAYAARQEDRRGTLEVGRFADLTFLDGDPLECAPELLRALRPVATVVNGRVEWSAPAPASARAPNPAPPQ